jgi:transcriptional regulator with XRE-family HTH domain
MREFGDDQVREIRKALAAGGITMTALAEEFGVSITTISHIAHRKTYRDVEDI